VDQNDKFFFEKRHQPAFAISLFLAMCAIAVSGLALRWNRGPLVDIDELQKQTAHYQIDLNRAQWPELVVLPGVGEKLATSIVEHREKIGRFRAWEELVEIPGIGRVKFEAIRPHLLPISDSD
jgi:competence ComEA-like helix-hairpin-helix protein